MFVSKTSSQALIAVLAHAQLVGVLLFSAFILVSAGLSNIFGNVLRLIRELVKRYFFSSDQILDN